MDEYLDNHCNFLSLSSSSSSSPNNNRYHNPMVAISPKHMLCQSIRKLEIGNNQYNDETMTELIVNDFPNLQLIDIGCNSFTFVRRATFSNLPVLKEITIGYASFRKVDTSSQIEGGDGICCIEKCDQLKTVKLSNLVFFDYHSLQIKGNIINR